MTVQSMSNEPPDWTCTTGELPGSLACTPVRKLAYSKVESDLAGHAHAMLAHALERVPP